VKPGDVRELADAISELLANPQLRARMGEAGRHRVDPAFRAETMVEQIASVYQLLLSRYAGRLSRFDRRQAPNMAEAMN
jgi:glycosyltransferase involved in cell wall biosynthesis